MQRRTASGADPTHMGYDHDARTRTRAGEAPGGDLIRSGAASQRPFEARESTEGHLDARGDERPGGSSLLVEREQVELGLRSSAVSTATAAELDAGIPDAPCGADFEVLSECGAAPKRQHESLPVVDEVATKIAGQASGDRKPEPRSAFAVEADKAFEDLFDGVFGDP